MGRHLSLKYRPLLVCKPSSKHLTGRIAHNVFQLEAANVGAGQALTPIPIVDPGHFVDNATSTGLTQKLSAVLYIQLMHVKESGVSVSVCMCVYVCLQITVVHLCAC